MHEEKAWLVLTSSLQNFSGQRIEEVIKLISFPDGQNTVSVQIISSGRQVCVRPDSLFETWEQAHAFCLDAAILFATTEKLRFEKAVERVHQIENWKNPGESQ